MIKQFLFKQFNSAFPKAPALVEILHLIVECHIQDIRWDDSYPSAKMQSVFSAAVADWGERFLVIFVPHILYETICISRNDFTSEGRFAHAYWNKECVSKWNVEWAGLTATIYEQTRFFQNVVILANQKAWPDRGDCVLVFLLRF